MARTAVRGRLTWQAVTVTSTVRETDSVRTIGLEVPGWPGHRAGQHLDVRLTAEDGYTAGLPPPVREKDLSSERAGLRHKSPPRSARGPVTETVSRLTGIVSAKGLKVFAVIDHSAEASQVGLQLRETTLVLFGNPPAGTPVMVAAPLAALDLPLKVLIRDEAGQTKVSYYGPATLAARYGLSADLAAIDVITDALIAP